MPEPVLPSATASLTEEEFAARVDDWSASPDRHANLAALLREDDAAYCQRGGAAVVRMRGWVLVGLARLGIDDADLPCVLEELESGINPYLVAAAARALRSYREPVADFVPFVVRAFANIRSSDEPVSFEAYGEYPVARSSPTALGELLLTLEWLVPAASESLTEIESLAGLDAPRRYRRDVNRIVKAIVRKNRSEHRRLGCCCRLSDDWGTLQVWDAGARQQGRALDRIVFEDHSGATASFVELFRGRPTIVVFFYTRCDNPLKCSLTVTKLARIQKVLADRGLAGDIQTAAITYDPQFDHPQRMARYGRDRGLRLDDRHRMLRTTKDFDAVQRHFALGVNFIESLVNRHRLEVLILDRNGNTAAQFSRLLWDEQKVIDRAIEILHEESGPIEPEGNAARDGKLPMGKLPMGKLPMGKLPMGKLPMGRRRARRRGMRALTGLVGVVASVGAAFFPKCPVCWAAYLSMFGVAGLGQIPYSPWVLPLLVAAMLINVASVGCRGRETGRMGPFLLVGAGALATLGVLMGLEWKPAAVAGVLFTLAGSFWSAFDPCVRPSPRSLPA